MDEQVKKELEAAGIDTSLAEWMPSLAIGMEQGQPAPFGEEALVYSGEAKALVKLKKISELFAGNAVPPDFTDGPTPGYEAFFCIVEMTVFAYCGITEVMETDQEIERLYNLLRRRPDGRDANPLFSYMQGAVRLYMSLFDVSRAEFEAVAGRLKQSAGTFSTGLVSRNYLEVIGAVFEKAYAKSIAARW